MMRFAEQQVRVELSFALIFRIGQRAVIVLCAGEEAGCRQRIRIQNTKTVRAEKSSALVCGKIIVRDRNATGTAERGASGGIVKLRDLIPRVGAQQLTEVALTHERCGHGHSLRGVKAVTHPILIHEDEEVITEGAHKRDTWNPHRPTHEETKIVINERYREES